MSFRPFSYDHSLSTWIASCACCFVAVAHLLAFIPSDRTQAINLLFVYYWVQSYFMGSELTVPKHNLLLNPA